MFGYAAAQRAYEGTKALGEVAVASECTMKIDGDDENIHYLIKQFPVPIFSPEDKIEVPLIGGLKTHVPQAGRFDFSGSIAFIETIDGKVRAFLEKLQAGRNVAKRPRFNATIYMGTPEEHTQSFRIIDAILHGFDPFDADVENRGQVVILQGQISYMCFPNMK